MKWLLTLYPPAWQRRYRRELESYLAAERATLRTSLDLIAGAADAWLNPGWVPATEPGGESMIQTFRCAPAEISKNDALRSGAMMIGVSLALTALAVMLDKALGDHLAIDALTYAAFFIALTVSSYATFLKPYSRVARNFILALGCVGWYLFFLGVAALAERLP